MQLREDNLEKYELSFNINTSRISCYCDISGRVTRDSSFDKYFSACAVIIATSEVDSLRSNIETHVPKWRDADPDSLTVVAKILSCNIAYSVVVRIEKKDPAWSRFWADADQQRYNLEKRSKKECKYVKGGNILTGYSLGKCGTIATGLHLRTNGVPILVDSRGDAMLRVRFICDTDLENKDSKKIFKDGWQNCYAGSKVREQYGIGQYLEAVEFKKEEEDRLLNIPDFLAGYAQYAKNTNRVALPNDLTNKDIKEFGNTLSNYKRFSIVDYSFDEDMPNLIHILEK